MMRNVAMQPLIYAAQKSYIERAKRLDEIKRTRWSGRRVQL